MIVFTPIENFSVELLEYKRVRQVVKFNLSSYYTSMPTLEALVQLPQNAFEELTKDENNFDQIYQQYIFTNDIAFVQFMNLIVPISMQPDCMVQVLIQYSNYRDSILESLIKIIQQRYGYNSLYIVNTEEDLLYTEESDFSIPGLFVLDQDLKRWASMQQFDSGDDCL